MTTTTDPALTGTKLPACPHFDPLDLMILRRIADGDTDDVIARNACISKRHLGRRVAAIRDETGAFSRVHAVSLGVIHQLVTTEHLSPHPVPGLTLSPSLQRYLDGLVTVAERNKLAKQMQRSPSAVASARNHLVAAFKARNTAQLAAFATLHGYVTCRVIHPAFPDIPFPQLTSAGQGPDSEPAPWPVAHAAAGPLGHQQPGAASVPAPHKGR